MPSQTAQPALHGKCHRELDGRQFGRCNGYRKWSRARSSMSRVGMRAQFPHMAGTRMAVKDMLGTLSPKYRMPQRVKAAAVR